MIEIENNKNISKEEVFKQVRENIKLQSEIIMDSFIDSFIKKLENSPKVFFERIIKSEIVLKNETGIDVSVAVNIEHNQGKRPDKIIITLGNKKIETEDNHIMKNNTEIEFRLTNEINNFMR